MRFRPEWMQLDTGISISRYFPAIGTAGLLRDLVSGKRRVPRPPPRISETTRGMEPLLHLLGKTLDPMVKAPAVLDLLGRIVHDRVRRLRRDDGGMPRGREIQGGIVRDRTGRTAQLGLAAAGPRRTSTEAPISPELGNHQPRDMFDSTALRAPSRSVPVACMYNLTACNLSPAARARQSRAIWHGSEST